MQLELPQYLAPPVLVNSIGQGPRPVTGTGVMTIHDWRTIAEEVILDAAD